MRASRFPWTLVAALLVHAPVAIALLTYVPRPRGAHVAPSAPDEIGELFVVSEELPAPGGAEGPSRSSPSILAPSAHAPHPEAHAATAPSDPGLGAAAAGPTVDESAPPATPLMLTREGPRDLGLSRTYGYDVVTPAPRRDDPSAGRTATDAIRAALDDRDRQLGLGAGGPVISALHAVTMSSRVPIESGADLWATTDSEGAVLSIVVRNLTGDPAPWNDVAASVLRELQGKRVSVPRGAKGMRLSFRVESRQRQVAGHATSDAARGASPLVTHENPQADRAPSLRLGTPTYRCKVACTGSGNVDPTDAALLATTHASRIIAVRSLGAERL